MSSISQVSSEMETILSQRAKALERSTGFVQRSTAQLDGPIFAQSTVLTWMHHPQAGYAHLRITAASLGVEVGKQAIEQRFSASSARLLQALFEEAVAAVISSEGTLPQVLSRFNGVYLQDGTIISLPQPLAQQWPAGAGTGKGAQLRLAHVLAAARARRGGCVGAGGQTRPLSGAPDRRTRQCPDRPGPQAARQPAHYPPPKGSQAHVPGKRKSKEQRQGKRKSKPVSAARLRLADWTILLTNVPKERLSVAEALVLARCRGPLELLWKLWKQQGKLDTWGSYKPERILTEIYAKLLGLLITHWLTLLGCWQAPNRSLHQAKQAVEWMTPCLALGFAGLLPLERVVAHSVQTLRGSRIDTRRGKPNTCQLLAQPELNSS